jgi:hypothetical protein
MEGTKGWQKNKNSSNGKKNLKKQLGVEAYTCPSTQRAEAGGLVESRSLGPDWETQ